MMKKFIKNKSKTKGDLAQLEKRIRYRFRDKDLLLRSLTHSSFAYENVGQAKDNELLEFLGDSVVGLIAADYFYRAYPDVTEGDLSKLKSSASSTIALAEFARAMALEPFLRLGKGEDRSGGRTKDSILAGLFEALVGAVHVDGGYEAARTVLLPFLQGTTKKIRGGDEVQINNYKSALQEFLQKENLPSPHYKVVSAKGPDHKKEFVVEVYVNKTSLAKAHGRSRKSAELKAAEMALKSFFGQKIKSLNEETFIFKK